MKADQSYCILTKSDFVFNLLCGYLFKINKEAGIYKGKTLFGKYITYSDKAVPSDKRLVITRVKNDNALFQTITIEKAIDFIPLAIEMVGVNNKEFSSYCKMHLKRKNIDSIFYYVSSMQVKCLDDNNRFNETIANYITKYTYKGVHTVTEKYNAIFDFISNPCSKSLYHLLNLYNDANGGFDAMVSTIANIVDGEKVPHYLSDRVNELFNDTYLLKNLLNISTALLKTRIKEEFIIAMSSGMYGTYEE